MILKEEIGIVALVSSDQNIDILCRRFLEDINGNEQNQMTIGIGNNIEQVSQILQSHKQAINAIFSGEVMENQDSVVSYDSLGILKLFFEVENMEVLQNYFEKSLRPIILYDQKNNTELVKTLDVLLQENCNIQKTAERLFIHRNTLNYRIHRICELTQKNFEDVGARYEFYTAILAMKFVSVLQQMPKENFLLDLYR